MTTTTTPTTGQHVKVLIGLYKGCTAKVVSTDRDSLLIAFSSGFRCRFQANELAVIRDL
jgi:hypothetical protein